jgi:copper ion binding protein
MKMQLTIGGMSCEHCVRAVTQAIEKVDGVKSVKVNLKKGKADIKSENVNIEAVKKAVADAGYTVE